MEIIKFKINGMIEEACKKHIEQALCVIDGVWVLEVKMGEATIKITKDKNFNEIITALKDVDYEFVCKI